MVLLPSLIGAPLSYWMPAPGDDDDDQRRRGSRRDSDREDPTILWAVQLSDGRKAVLVTNEGYQLFVCSSISDMRIFRGTEEVAEALINMGINNFEDATAELPSVLKNNIKLKLKQGQLRLPFVARAAS